MIPVFPAAAGGYVEFVEREAIFFSINDEDRVVHAGRRAVPLGTTWLEAALEWSQDAGFVVALPRTEYVAESTEPGESLIVIYRPRDNQYVLPFVPPKEKLLFANLRNKLYALLPARMCCLGRHTRITIRCLNIA